MLSSRQMLKCGAVVSAVLGVGLLADCVFAQDTPKGSSSWFLPRLDAASLEFSVLKLNDGLGTKGRVRIRGVAKNSQGGVADGDNTASLWLSVGGKWKPLVKQPIPPLSANACSQLVYDCDWDKNAPAGTAFKFLVEIGSMGPNHWSAVQNASSVFIIRASSDLSALLKPGAGADLGNPPVKAQEGPPGTRWITKPNWPKPPTPWERFRQDR